MHRVTLLTVMSFVFLCGPFQAVMSNLLPRIMLKRSALFFPNRGHGVFPRSFNPGNAQGTGLVDNVVGLVGDTVRNVATGVSSIGNAAGGIVNGLTRRLG
ncbi:hypothetical protein TNCT_191521 [Trichonephila clavata]|uniref:Secreted protein n=1 Tax=Trichonephila clavata TaxID=2740835 RepID=A0A8X6GE80_TRICU|nr:hypothetical protein TNCT_191521 [Trichonephila clavata]